MITGVNGRSSFSTRQTSNPLAEGSKDFVAEIRAQALIAIEEADVVVLLVDADPQGSALDWSSSRQGDSFVAVVGLPTFRADPPG